MMLRSRQDIEQEDDLPTAGSRVAWLRVSTKEFFCAREAGFILKFPPTKNWRVIFEFCTLLRWIGLREMREGIKPELAESIGFEFVRSAGHCRGKAIWDLEPPAHHLI